MSSEPEESVDGLSKDEDHSPEYFLFILEERDLKPNLFGILHVQVNPGEVWLIFRDGLRIKTLLPGPHTWWAGFFHKWRMLRFSTNTELLETSVEGRVKGPPPWEVTTNISRTDIAYEVEVTLSFTCRIANIDIYLQHTDPLSTLLAQIRNIAAEVIGSLSYDQYGEWATILRDIMKSRLQPGGVDDAERLTGFRIEDMYVTSVTPDILRERGIIHANLAGSERSKETSPTIVESTLERDANYSDSGHGEDNYSPSHSLSILQIRIVEDPLTVQNVVLILSALMELYTKCWLIKQDRLDDLIEFTQNHNTRFYEEANLTILQMTRNSPADFKFNVNADVSAQGLAEALKAGIDAVTLAPLRHEEAKLLNQAKVLDNRLREQEAQSALAEKEQVRHIEAQKAEIEAQKAQLELEKQKIELAKQQLALQKERLQLEIATRDFAFETAEMMIERLYPDADAKTKALLARTLVPNLLQLGSAKGLLALPESRSAENTNT